MLEMKILALGAKMSASARTIILCIFSFLLGAILVLVTFNEHKKSVDATAAGTIARVVTKTYAQVMWQTAFRTYVATQLSGCSNNSECNRSLERAVQDALKQAAADQVVSRLHELSDAVQCDENMPACQKEIAKAVQESASILLTMLPVKGPLEMLRATQGQQ